MTGLTSREEIGFVAYLSLVGLMTMISTVIVTRWAEHDQAMPADDATARHWLATWAIVSGGSLLVVAALGGLLSFSSRAPWAAVLTLPFAAGAVVGASVFMTMVVMGQTRPGSASCGIDETNCNITFGMGAALLSLVAAIPLGTTFILAHLARRALARLLSPRR